MSCIYLDHNATTPVDPRVLDAMLPYLREQFGNASSKNHPYGWQAKEAVELARQQVARLLGASVREILFTSGATESNNIALLGSVAALPSSAFRKKEGGSREKEGAFRTRESPPRPGHVVSQEIEHPAVLDTLAELERRGHEVTLLQPDAAGLITAEQVRAALKENTFLVTVMAANNEIGTLAPLAQIGAVCREAGVLFHSDAAQAVGKIPLDVRADGLQLLSLSAHKLYGPKGIGALFVNGRGTRTRVAPLHFGGGQERGIRPGTLNVPGIVGLGAACTLAEVSLEEEGSRLSQLRSQLEDGLRNAIDGVHVNGSSETCLPGTLSMSFEGVDGTALLLALPGLALSSGSACSTDSAAPSKVLKSIGLSDALALATLRFGLGRHTTQTEVDATITQVRDAVNRLRAQAPGSRMAKKMT